MRIVLPCATIAAITSAWGLLVSADGGAAAAKELDAIDDGVDGDDEYIATTRSRVPRSMRDAAEEEEGGGEECDRRHLEQGMIDANADVGVLRCGPGKTCAADVTSSVGGRCVASVIERPDAPRMAVFPSRDLRATMTKRGEHASALRRLQNSTTEEDEEFVCPTNCPQSFCDCARGVSEDGEQADAFTCAPELHSVCITELIPECVPGDLLTFYTETYCPFAACVVVSSDTYENCSCEYYKDYCRAYYAFEQSIDKCAIGTCCDSQPDENKFVCLPELAPTGTPTESPTDTNGPSLTPTVSAEPTITPMPTISSPPSSSPTISSAPTVSPAPTPPPSDPPTVSPAPTITSSPTSSSVPTPVPTVAPLSSPPTVEPSDSPIVTPAPMIVDIPAGEGDDANNNMPGSVVASPPSAAHRPIIGMATLAASLFFGAGGAFWIFA